MKIAIVCSQFNLPITEVLLKNCLIRLEEKGLSSDQVRVYKVPGVVEIPLIAQNCARSDAYHAIICLGVVIRGETTHYDWVCSQVSQGCQQVALQENIPVIFGILTTENTEQAYDRLGGAKGDKGKEMAEAAFSMIDTMSEWKK